MKYRILCVGKVKEEFYRKRIDGLLQNVSGNDSLQIVEVPDEKTEEHLSATERQQILRIEGERLLRLMPYQSKELVVALCIHGRQYSTEAWKARVRALTEQNEYEQITYVIGTNPAIRDSGVSVYRSCNKGFWCSYVQGYRTIIYDKGDG
jgi:23S rRNA (pseudouridine1915-N3)-methyltransferase